MNIIFLVITLIATVLLYASHPHQGLLSQPLAIKPWRYLGALLLVLGLLFACWIFSTITAVFTWITISLLSFSVLPFLSLLIKKKNQRELQH
jgi:drug/metabolite transporter (DMT)-like permease